MNADVRSTLINAVASLLVAIIGAAGTVWVARERQAAQESRDASKAAPALELSVEAAGTAAETTSNAVAAGTLDGVRIRTIQAKVESDDKPLQDSSSPELADVCVLTNVSSYGGATKGCSLKREVAGWVLTANARKATSFCQATCFDIRGGT